MAKIVRTAAKRRIERRKASTNVLTNTSTQTIILHTVEDSGTLVRVLLELGLMPVADDDTDIENVVQWALGIKPVGVTVMSSGITSSLDQVTPLAEIAKGHLQAMANATTGVGMGTPTRTFDIKAMRKLVKGDLIVLNHTALESSNCRMPMLAYMWIKE